MKKVRAPGSFQFLPYCPLEQSEISQLRLGWTSSRVISTKHSLCVLYHLDPPSTRSDAHGPCANVTVVKIPPHGGVDVSNIHPSASGPNDKPWYNSTKVHSGEQICLLGLPTKPM